MTARNQAIRNLAFWLISMACPATGIRTSHKSAETNATVSATHQVENPTYKYYWPEPRGRPGSYSRSPYTGPHISSKTLAWTWTNNGPDGKQSKYTTGSHFGLVMDDEFSSYMSSADGVRKISIDGKVLWFSPIPTGRIPTLDDGKVYITADHGEAVALDMKTGTVVGASRITEYLGMDIEGTIVRDGIMVAGSGGQKGGAKTSVVGLNASDGKVLWEFPTDQLLWNFMPMVTHLNTIIFQDRIGGVYHFDFHNGRKLWKAGYSTFTDEKRDDFTDGLPMVDGDIVYAVHSDGNCCPANQPANLRAYNLHTGQELWKSDFKHPANSQPAVGYIGQGAGLRARKSVVMPIGAQPVGEFNVYGSSIIALDAETGEKVWEFEPPAYLGRFVAGDEERMKRVGWGCMPNPYGSPTIDASGTVYTGHFNGMIYAIRDNNGDGIIQADEVSSYNTESGFSHGGFVIAPGMAVIPSCDAVYAFRD